MSINYPIYSRSIKIEPGRSVVNVQKVESQRSPLIGWKPKIAWTGAGEHGKVERPTANSPHGNLLQNKSEGKEMVAEDAPGKLLLNQRHVEAVSGMQKPQDAAGNKLIGEEKEVISQSKQLSNHKTSSAEKPHQVQNNKFSATTRRERKVNSHSNQNRQRAERPTYVFKGNKVKQEISAESADQKHSESKKQSSVNSRDKFKPDAVNPFPTREDVMRQKLNYSSRHNFVMYGPVEPFYEYAGDLENKSEPTFQRRNGRGTTKTSAPLASSTPRPSKKHQKPGPRKTSKPPKMISQTGSLLKPITEHVTPSMKENFKTILSHFPDGITISDLFLEYKKIFDVDIKYYNMGYISMSTMIRKLPEIFKMEYVRGTRYFLLYDAQIPTKTYEKDSLFIPSYIQRRIAEIVYDHYYPMIAEKLIEEYWKRYSEKLDAKRFGFKHIAHILCECPRITFSILKGIVTVFRKEIDYIGRHAEFSRDQIHSLLKHYFQPDFLDITFVYKRPIIHSNSNQAIIVETGNTEELYFYIHFMEVNSEFENFMSELNTFYVENEANYTLSKEALVPDLAVAAIFSENMLWHRAIILKTCYKFHQANPDHYKLLFVDYGTIKIVHEDDIKALAKRFGEYPMFAVPSKLYGITYINDPKTNLEINRTFIELIDRDIYIKVAKVGSISFHDNSECPFLDLVVVDPTTNDCLNEKMVETNHAIFEEEDEIAGWKLEIRCELIEKTTNLEKVLQCYNCN